MLAMAFLTHSQDRSLPASEGVEQASHARMRNDDVSLAHISPHGLSRKIVEGPSGELAPRRAPEWPDNFIRGLEQTQNCIDAPIESIRADGPQRYEELPNHCFD